MEAHFFELIKIAQGVLPSNGLNFSDIFISNIACLLRIEILEWNVTNRKKLHIKFNYVWWVVRLYMLLWDNQIQKVQLN